jgi:hypothetical protein
MPHPPGLSSKEFNKKNEHNMKSAEQEEMKRRMHALG